MYYIAETQSNEHITPNHWVACKAKTLSGAKCAAQAARAFKGTVMHIGVKNGEGDITRVATRYNTENNVPDWQNR